MEKRRHLLLVAAFAAICIGLPETSQGGAGGAGSCEVMDPVGTNVHVEGTAHVTTFIEDPNGDLQVDAVVEISGEVGDEMKKDTFFGHVTMPGPSLPDEEEVVCQILNSESLLNASGEAATTVFQVGQFVLDDTVSVVGQLVPVQESQVSFQQLICPGSSTMSSNCTLVTSGYETNAQMGQFSVPAVGLP